jgi:hypothetical protein
MRAAAVSYLSELSQRMDDTQIFPAIDVDYDSRLERGWFRIIPEKEFFSIASKGDFYQVSHL